MEAGNTLSRTPRSRFRFASLASLGAAALGVVSLASLTGCGSTYRPVVAAINPVGPSAQPSKFAVALSSPSPTTPGIVTIIDFSGDSVLITANVGANPGYLALGGLAGTSGTTGTNGFVINGDGTLSNFGVSASLITSQILQTTLLANATPPTSLFPQGTNTYVTEPARNAIAELQATAGTNNAASSGAALSLKQELNVSQPSFVVGINAGPRVYALSKGDGTPTNLPQAIGIDTATNNPINTAAPGVAPAIPLGNNPVYGVMTADGKRVFVMNEGDGTVSVINAQTNALDTFSATAPVPGGATPPSVSTIKVGTNPVWADFAQPLSEMVVANAGDGTGKGSLSIVSIPLCNAAAQGSNVNCDPNNPVDAIGFGTVLANVPVGINPIQVATLADGTRAYIANAGNKATSCVDNSGNATGSCSVSVVNLTTETVTATIPLACHPSYIAATTGTPTGKVYVVCSDGSAAAKNLTVIRTDIDAIDLTIPLQGNGVSVRVSAP